jgi:hypothetical protein
MPYVMVMASQTVEKKMAANNLTPAEFLRPFGEVGNLGGYTMRTNDKNDAVKLQNFRVNFVDSQMLRPDPARTGNKVVDLIFKECKPRQDEKIKNLNRNQAKQELIDKIGSSRKVTE